MLLHCEESCLRWLHWYFSNLPVLKPNPRCCAHTRTQSSSERNRGMLRYPHAWKRLASVLLFQLAAVCEVNLLLASAEGLGKTVKCFPVTRKWDSSCARECRKKSRFRRSLVVCTNITLKYSVWNVCSVKQRKTIARFYNHPRYTSLPTDLFLPSEVCIILFIFVTSVSRGGEIIKKHLGVSMICWVVPLVSNNTICAQ